MMRFFFLSLLCLAGSLQAADYPPNKDYGSLGDFVVKRGVAYGRTADLNLVGPLLVNLPEAPGSSSNGIPWRPRDTVWDLSDLTNPTLIRELNCETCPIGSPIFAHATVVRFENGEAYLYKRSSSEADSWDDHLIYNPDGATSNEQAVSTEMPNRNYVPMSYPMMFSPYHLRRWWDYGDNPAGPQWIRDPSRLLPEGEPERWLGEIFVSWDHLGLTGVTGFAAWLGNLVVMASDQQSTGMAIYDVSGFKDGSLPRLLSVYQPTLTEPDGNQVGIGGYWVEPYGTNKMVWAARQRGTTPERHYPGLFMVDFSDPENPALSCEVYFNQDANDPSDGDDSSDPMYVNFQDEYAYVDHFRVNLDACEQAYADDQHISSAEFKEIVYRFDDVGNNCDGSQYFRPLGQVGVFGGYDYWRTQSIVHYTGDQMPLNSYMVNQDNLGFFAVRHLGPGVSIVDTNLLAAGDHLRSTGSSLEVDVTQVVIDENINEQGMCFMVTSDAPDTRAPYVSGHRPTADQINYPVDGFIHIHIPETLRTETVANAVTVKNLSTQQLISFRQLLSHTGTLSIWPDHDLDLGVTYEVSVSGIQDFMGNTMAPYSFRFSTGVEIVGEPVPDPTDPDDPAPSHDGDTYYPVQSSQLACTPENEALPVWVVNPDNHTVALLTRQFSQDGNTLTLSKERELNLGYESPTSVTHIGNYFAVTYRDDDKILFFDEQGNPVRSVDSGHGTQPVSSLTDGTFLYVALYASGEIIKINPQTGQIDARLTVGPSPKAMALQGSRLLVTRFISTQQYGQVYDVDTQGSMQLSRIIQVNKIQVPDDIDHGSGVPNYLAGIVIDPAGEKAYITATKANVDRGLFRNHTVLDADNTVRPAIVTLDLINNRDWNQNPMTKEGTIDLDNAADPHGISYLPDGKTRVHTLQGNNLVVVNNLEANTSANFATGFAPQSVCTTLRTLYVKNFTDRTVSAIDISGWMHNGSQNPGIQTLSTVAHERFSPQKKAGQKLFYHARIPDISPEGYISCASCHAGGGQDGMVWDMTHMGEGLRNTLSLNGASGTRFGNLHWSSNFDEVQDFEIQLERLNGGTGLIPGLTFGSGDSPVTYTTSGQSQELDALAAYVNQLGRDKVTRSPFRTYIGELTPAAQRGESVFQQKGCQSCHSGAAFRDGLSHDVGTIKASSGNRLGIEGGLVEIRTPSLIELWQTAPFYHDGSAATLADVFDQGTSHQVTFNGSEKEDLIQYLLSIDREMYIADE